MLKELQLRPNPRLIARNPQYGLIDLPEDSDLEIWGVVTHTARTMRSS